MAGSSAVITYEDDGPIKVIDIPWTSDDTTGAWSTTTRRISGSLLHAVTDPGATAPTTLYDITIKDAEAFDVLTNCVDDLADRSATVTERVDFFLTTGGGRPTVSDILTIAGANCGNSKVGQLRLYYVQTAVG